MGHNCLERKKEEAVRYDHDGTFDNSGHGWREELGENEGRIPCEDGNGNNEPSVGRGHDEHAPLVEKGEEEDFAVAVARSWAGLIPAPEDFNSYDEEIQRKIVEWTDARIIDESKRQDKLVAATVRSSMFSSIASFVVNIVIIIGVLAAFVATRDASVFWAFTIPGASIVGNVAINIRKGEDEKR